MKKDLVGKIFLPAVILMTALFFSSCGSNDSGAYVIRFELDGTEYSFTKGYNDITGSPEGSYDGDYIGTFEGTVYDDTTATSAEITNG